MRDELGCLARRSDWQEGSSVSCLSWVRGQEASRGREEGAEELGRATGTGLSGEQCGPQLWGPSPYEATQLPPRLPGAALVWPQPRHSSHCLPSRGVGHPGPRPTLRPVRRFTPDS